MKQKKAKPLTNLAVKSVLPRQWSARTLTQIMERWQGKRILVIGDVGVDRYTLGSVERISPEAPVPIVRVESETLKLGLAANVADNIQALGAEPVLLGVIGDDRCGEDLKRLLRHNRMDPEHLVIDRSRRTVLKERIVSDRQQLLRVDYENIGPISLAVLARVEKSAIKLLESCDGVIVEDYAKGLLNRELMATLGRAARRMGKLVVTDPNRIKSVIDYRGATLLKPNWAEAEVLAGMRIHDRATLLGAGQKLLSQSRAKYLVITRGKEGMALFSAESQTVHLVPAHVREVYDVSGAGDTVIAVLGLALSTGASLLDSSILGNLAAGVEVGKRGTATVTPAEILESLGQR